VNIGIATDHRGYNLKKQVIKQLTGEGHNVVDYGTYSNEPVDYTDYGTLLGENLIKGEFEQGIAICGTGIGMSIACNKVKGVRCAKVDNIEEARLARDHNDANIIAINSGKNFEEIREIIQTFLNTSFSNLERHKLRVDKIKEYENKEKEHEY
jgi:ribose 5-phosphate isomerase B